MSTAAIPDSLILALREAQHVAVLTGAGASAESGVPTFRDAMDGFWSQYDPQMLATPDAFEADPELVWKWYRWRREMVAEAEPNPGHIALAELGRRLPGLSLITQNVDGLHQRAGSTDVIEFHGNIFADICFSSECDYKAPESADSGLPTCPSCGALLRPGVVWFGEAIPEAAQAAAMQAAKCADVFLSIGTSSLVYPAAGLTSLARDNGALTVEINPNPTPQTDAVDIVIADASGRVLPSLLEALYPS